MMTPERRLGELIQQELDGTRAGVVLIEMTETVDGRKFALRIRDRGGREHLVLLYKRAVARILARPSSDRRLRALIGAELGAQECRRNGSAPPPQGGADATGPRVPS